MISAVFFYILYWVKTNQPSNNRNWQEDVAVLAYADIDGDKVTIHNIRNFDYQTEYIYQAHYYTKEFNLNDLKSVDLIVSYWMGPAIAHTFLSFGFGEGTQIAISIETRKEKGEEYSSIKGFFNQYELYYVVADERDVIRLRTNYRHNPEEEVYLYQLVGSKENIRRIFIEYLEQINHLKTNPEFYNSLTHNCTTSIWINSRVNAKHLPFNWKILLSGYLPELLYDNHRIKNYGLSFSDLKKHAKINHRALIADKDKNFTLSIREGLK